jgi:hypothetical protein
MIDVSAPVTLPFAARDGFVLVIASSVQWLARRHSYFAVGVMVERGTQPTAYSFSIAFFCLNLGRVRCADDAAGVFAVSGPLTLELRLISNAMGGLIPAPAGRIVARM